MKANVWYARDIKAIAAAKHWSDDAPFYVEQESPVPPGGWPKPGRLVVNLPDNHLQYALTWFGGALVLARPLSPLAGAPPAARLSKPCGGG